MLNVKLICVGRMREKYYIDAFAEYAKRLGAYCRFECLELPEQRLSDAPAPGGLTFTLSNESGLCTVFEFSTAPKQ